MRLSRRSGNPAFVGGNLPKRFGERYRHVRAFGNANYRTSGPIEIVDLEAGMKSIDDLVQANTPIILMCACRDVSVCHRKVLAEAFGCEVQHLC